MAGKKTGGASWEQGQSQPHSLWLITDSAVEGGAGRRVAVLSLRPVPSPWTEGERAAHT